MQVLDPVSLVLKLKGSDVWWVPPTASVYEALGIMSEKEIGALVVISGGKLSGVVSERDYARKVVLLGKSSKHTLVGEIMATPVIFVSPSHTVDECMRIITAHRVRHLPVVEADKVIGVISIGDLVNWIITTQQEAINHLEAYITGKYPG